MLARSAPRGNLPSRGDLDVAARDFRAAALLDPTATRPLEALGDVLYAQERFRRSAETYEARLTLDDRSAPVRYKLALARYRDGSIDAALDEARRAVALDDQMADAHYLIALCLRDKGLPEDAVAALAGAPSSVRPGCCRPARNWPTCTPPRAGSRSSWNSCRCSPDSTRDAPNGRWLSDWRRPAAGRAELAVATLTAALDQAADQSPVNAALGRVWLQLAESRSDRPDAVGGRSRRSNVPHRR